MAAATAAGQTPDQVRDGVVERFKVSPRTAYRYVRRMADELQVTVMPSTERPPDLPDAAPLEITHPSAFAKVMETAEVVRERWSKKLEGWVDKVEADLEAQEVAAKAKETRTVVGKDGIPYEVAIEAPTALERATVYAKLIAVVERLHKLRGADAPQQVVVSGAIAHAHATLRDPLAMSPAERRRELDELKERRKQLASGAVIDVQGSEEG